MIKFDPNKTKSISMLLETEGIEPSRLEAKFRIIVDSVEYGFSCKIIEDKIQIIIPPLKKIIPEIKNGSYPAKLEINGEDKYYIKPFEGSIEVKAEPKLAVQLENEEDKLQETKDIKIKEVKEDKEEEIIEVETKEEKHSKLGIFLKG